MHGDVGAFVADALNADEQAAFEAHLAHCESCQREVAEFGETAAEMSALAATPPPAALRASVLSAISTVRPLPPPDGPAEVPPRSVPEVAPAVDELAVRRQQRLERLLRVAVAAALVVALALGGWVYALSTQQRALLASEQLETELLSAPDARVYRSTLDGQPVSFVVSRQLDKAMFVGADVADPGPGSTYQLWTITAAKEAVPDELIEQGGSVRQWFAEPVRDAAALAVTREPRGGSTKPTMPILSTVALV